MNPEVTTGDGLTDRAAQLPGLDALADRIQPAVRDALEGNGPVRGPLKNLLHGTFLGHPLHPLITDIPIGAWSLAAVMDVLEMRGSVRYRDAADLAIGIGALGAVAAAVTGLADWSDTAEKPRRIGMVHALLNSAALASYGISLAARKAGARRAGIATAFLGYATMTAAAYLGGELSFGMQLGVKHTALAVNPPDDWERVLDASALAAGDMQTVTIDAGPFLLTREGDTVHAVSDVCTHRGAPLHEGERTGGCITCPWHGSRFALDDGRVVEGPATFGLARLDARLAGGEIALRAADA
jgi:nitrite reductase/ring-hydroxylating ferredoxin subunit/uncharacterized membrane protein